MKKLVFLLISSLLLFLGDAAHSQDKADTISATITIAENPTSLSPGEPRDGKVKTGTGYIMNKKTGECETQDVYGNPPRKVTDLYMEGGYIFMSMITLCLIAMLFAAWKAPRWVKEIGLLALIIGTFYFAVGLYEMSDILTECDIDVPSGIFFAGFRVALIAPMYGMIVYGISLLLRIGFKPRI